VYEIPSFFQGSGSKKRTPEEKKMIMEAISKAADEIIEVKPEEVQK